MENATGYRGKNHTASNADYSIDSEGTPLLVGRTRHHSHWLSWLAMRCGGTRKCVSSKAALLILLWAFVIRLFAFIPLNLEFILRLFISNEVHLVSHYIGILSTIVSYSFFPLAGYLADVKYGRYKTIFVSLCLILVSVIIFLLIVGPLVFVVVSTSSRIARVLLCVSEGILIIVFYVGFVGFSANVVQFGMDQLYDSPGEDRTLFIHWFVWVTYASSVPIRLVFSFAYKFPNSETFGVYYELTAYYLEALAVAVVLATTLCLAQCQRRWFLIEPGQYNPYKLVYKVTKFARQHKTPMYRSAFTYCEDELPRGLDLGKDKYGGPFTTEQVEDVKTFYGVLTVILSAWLVELASYSLLPSTISANAAVVCNATVNNATEIDVATGILINQNLLWYFLPTVCIPLYLYLLRPLFRHSTPGMLRRVGLGLIVKALSVPIQAVVYFMADNCIEYPSLNSALSFTRLCLLVLSAMLMFIGGYEFICSQCPHSMKGLLFGLFYAAQGFYRLVGLVIAIPYLKIPLGSVYYYYVMNTVIGLVALFVYAWVAKRYRYRVRDEPCHVHQYAEEYYSNPNRERNYDYSDNEQDRDIATF